MRDSGSAAWDWLHFLALPEALPWTLAQDLGSGASDWGHCRVLPAIGPHHCLLTGCWRLHPPANLVQGSGYVAAWDWEHCQALPESCVPRLAQDLDSEALG